MAQNLAKQHLTKQAAKKMFGTVGGAAVNVAVGIAQQANNRIINQLLDDRHTAKLNEERQKISRQYTISSLQYQMAQIQEELTAKTNTIEQEEKKISKFENVNNDVNTKFIVALGMTGDGKSTVLNRLYGDKSQYGNEGPFEANTSDQSVTQEPSHREKKICNVQSVIVDTPGYKDSDNKDDEHLNDLGEYLFRCGGVDAFLLVMNGAKNRFDADIQDMLKEYGKYFGSDFWRHLIIIITRIEWIEKKRYNDEDKAEKLRKNIRNTIDDVDEKCALPVITIGFGEGEDLAAFRSNVMREVERISSGNSKLVCTHVPSPIRILRGEKQTLERQIENFNDQITPIQQEIEEIDARIAVLDAKIENPEKFPLITNYNGRI